MAMTENFVRFGKRHLAGVLHQPSKRSSASVITCHGLYSHKDSQKYVEIARRFCEEGLVVLRFDFTGCGESRGKFEDSTLSMRINDLESALDFMEQQQHQEIGVMGSSLGGCISILTASRDERIKALTTWATPYYLKKIFSREETLGKFREDIKTHDMAKAAEEVTQPTLIIHGSQDKLVPLSHTHALYRELKLKHLEIIEGADHRFTNPTHRVKAIDFTLNWFKNYLVR